MASKSIPHPLEPLSIEESHRSRDIVLGAHKLSIIDFRSISLEEPPKTYLQPFLHLEHSGQLTATTQRPARVARVTYDVIGPDKIAKYFETLIDIRKGIVVSHEVVEKPAHAALTLYSQPLPSYVVIIRLIFIQRRIRGIDKGRSKILSFQRRGCKAKHT
jgi:primary-amine oxidase